MEYKCKNCEKTFGTKNEYQLHLVTFHDQNDDSTKEMMKSIKQEKYTEDDVKRKKQSVEDSSLELALKHSRELLIIKKEISNSYNNYSKTLKKVCLSSTL